MRAKNRQASPFLISCIKVFVPLLLVVVGSLLIYGGIHQGLIHQAFEARYTGGRGAPSPAYGSDAVVRGIGLIAFGLVLIYAAVRIFRMEDRRETYPVEDVPPEIRESFDKALGRSPGPNYGKGPDPTELYKAVKALVRFGYTRASGNIQDDGSGIRPHREQPPSQHTKPVGPRSSLSYRTILIAVGILVFVGLLFFLFRAT